MKPRVLFVSRGPSRPGEPGVVRKWDAMSKQVELRLLTGGESGLAFYGALPARIARELRRFRPHAVVAQGAHETAAALAARRFARVDTAVIADIHGDWQAPTRLYGSRWRSSLNPVADRLALSALRNADGIRTVTGYTTSLVRELGLEPADEFPAYMDFDSFLQTPPQPLPAQPQALFVGVLERYKNVDGLAEGWRIAAPRVPGARLWIVGTGALRSVVQRLVRELPEQTRWTEHLSQHEVSDALDQATALVLPSRSEGMGRVIVEAFCRGRPVVGSRVGGIPDLVEDGVNGLLVEPGETQELADALVRVLTDRELTERLSAQAQASSALWTISAEEFASRFRALVERIAGLS